MAACGRSAGPEIAALPILARGAALRFLLTRLHDWLTVPAGALVVPKDPLEYYKKLRFHRGVAALRLWARCVSERPRVRSGPTAPAPAIPVRAAGAPSSSGTGHEKELSGGEPVTTNNRMELMAAIAALEALKRGEAVDLYTDSQYLRGGITGWIHGWKKNGWRTSDRKPVKNTELWQRLDAAGARHDITWHWVRGHAGTEANERADALARKAMAPFKKKRNIVE